ncbi:Uncharacterized protein HZ326_21810 [Fusarium oxysporum f. sp. albedinis]|nr:Uncharacterized protein HZ326_21810 [Fusarium oxysporum f. sp. albedinis]
MKRAWLGLDSGMSWLPSPSKKERKSREAFDWSTSRCYLLFAQKTSNSCIPVYPWCCLFTLDTIYGGEMDLSEIFMPKVAYFGAPLRPLNNLAAEGRAHALPAAGCRDKDSGLQFHIVLTSHAPGAN